MNDHPNPNWSGAPGQPPSGTAPGPSGPGWAPPGTPPGPPGPATPNPNIAQPGPGVYQGAPGPAPYGAVPGPYGSGPGAGGSSGLAIAVMVLGIVGLCLSCVYGIGVVLAIVALCLAPSARRDVQAKGYASGDGMIKAGAICSWISVVIGIVFALIFALAVVMSARDGYNSSMGPADRVVVTTVTVPSGQ